MTKTGKLFVITAPSGAGKTSLVKALIEKNPQIRVSISHTTRSARPGEQPGVDYFFISKQQFESMLQENAFLEHARVYDNYYGTAREPLMTWMRSGVDVILEIDWQGARQVKQKIADVINIFILPPSKQALEDRLRARQQDSGEVIQRRMRQAVEEISHYVECNYVIVNDDFEQALNQLITLFTRPANFIPIEREALRILGQQLLQTP